MKRIAGILLLSTLLFTHCKRRLTTEQLKENLMTAMSDQLEKRRPAGAPPLHFKVTDVIYYENVQFYDCEFTIRLTRADGTDTVGIVKGKVAKDFSYVK